MAIRRRLQRGAGLGRIYTGRIVQHGHGRVFAGRVIQRGHGLGNIFASLFRRLLPAVKNLGRKIISSPITKNILDSAKKSAIKAGIHTAQDVLSGENVGETLKKNIKQVGSDVRDAAIQEIAGTQEGNGRRRRSRRLKALKKTPSRRSSRQPAVAIVRDIFDGLS